MANGDNVPGSKLSVGELLPLLALARLSPLTELTFCVVPCRSDNRLEGAREFNEDTWLPSLAEPFIVPVVDCREDRAWGGTVEGGAMEGRGALAAVVRFRDIAAGVLSRVVPPCELFKDSCFVGDLVGD